MNSVEHYLARGLDRRTAEYFAAGRRTIVRVTPERDFTILLDFDNGERRRLDMTGTRRWTAAWYGTTRWTSVRTPAIWTAFLCERRLFGKAKKSGGGPAPAEVVYAFFSLGDSIRLNPANYKYNLW